MVVTSMSDAPTSDDWMSESCERYCCTPFGVRLYRCRHDAGLGPPTCVEMHRSACAGNVSRVRRLHENGCPWDAFTCQVAAMLGRLDCLKYMHENGCPWDALTCLIAAMRGHLDCLKYAHENGCPWDVKGLTCQIAAMRGHLECLKYAHENGCPWDEGACHCAAKDGHLDCLKYLHENGCPWNALTCQLAAKFCQLECLKYAYEHGCPWDEGFREDELFPEVKNAVDLLQQELRESIPNDMYEIARENLQVLHDDHCCEIPRDAGLDVFQRRIANRRDVSRRNAPLRNTMDALDEVKETISNASYVRMSACLKRIHDCIVNSDAYDIL